MGKVVNRSLETEVLNLLDDPSYSFTAVLKALRIRDARIAGLEAIIAHLESESVQKVKVGDTLAAERDQAREECARLKEAWKTEWAKYARQLEQQRDYEKADHEAHSKLNGTLTEEITQLKELISSYRIHNDACERRYAQNQQAWDNLIKDGDQLRAERDACVGAVRAALEVTEATYDAGLRRDDATRGLIEQLRQALKPPPGGSMTLTEALEKLEKKARNSTPIVDNDPEYANICRICENTFRIHDAFDPTEICDCCAQEYFEQFSPQIILALCKAVRALQEFTLHHKHNESNADYRPLGDTYGYCSMCRTNVGLNEDFARDVLAELARAMGEEG